MRAESLRKFEKVCQIVEKYERDPAKLIPILQEAQEQYRYLPEEILTFLATSLGISPAQVYGVATFYSHFTLTPKGKYVVRVCDGTACHVRNSSTLIDTVRAKLKLGADQNTTADMLFSLETVSCLGACGLAPVLVINEEVHGQCTPQKVNAIIDALIEKEKQNAN